MKKIIVMIMCLMMLFVTSATLVACGGGSDSSNSDGTSSDGGDTTTPTVEYTITFDAGEIATIESVTAEEGKAIEEPTAPSVNDYAFVGYYTTGDYMAEFDFDSVITEDTTIYACYIEATTNLTYTLISDETEFDGTYSVKANGSDIGDVIVPDMTNDIAVTIIEEEAFCPEYAGDTTITSVVLGQNVKQILYCAFGYCPNLENIYLNKVEFIDEWAFYDTGLTSVTIPDNVVVCGGAFSYIDSLLTVVVGNGVTLGSADDEYGVFENCEALTTVEFGDNVTIGDEVFEFCELLETVKFSGKVSIIGEYAFSDCTALTTVEFGGEAILGEYAFDGCTSLTTIDLTNVTYIGYKAFTESGLTSVTIPDNTIVYEGAFCYIDSLLTVVIGNNVTLGSVDDYYGAFESCENITTVTIGDNVTIGCYAFYSCVKLETVTIGDDVNVPEDPDWGSCAFMDCYGLTTLNIGDNAYIGVDAFYGCDGLSNVTIGLNYDSNDETLNDILIS